MQILSGGELDEIDARVWCYLKFEQFGTVDRHRHAAEEWLELETKGGLDVDLFAHELYTHSRNALKAIRPKEHRFSIVADAYGRFTAYAYKNNDEKKQHAAPTEELAELHVIIQAIDHDRQLANVAATSAQPHDNVTVTS